ncbi:MAG: histidine phosphatase family protein [Clostridia bacterium]|nr:histidine phosphatase family protein [Clostridia bacterium]
MIYIIRHGITEMNKAGLLQGRIDVPLSDEGVKQAEEAAAKLRHIQFDRVFSSPLIRAVRTAEIVAPGIGPILDDRLLEMDYGPYEGMDLRNPPPEVLGFFKDFAHVTEPEGMESLDSVVARAGSFLEDIRCFDQNILIATHAIAMKGLLEYLTPQSEGAYWSKYIGNCAVYTVENAGGSFGVPREFLGKGARPPVLP